MGSQNPRTILLDGLKGSDREREDDMARQTEKEWVLRRLRAKASERGLSSASAEWYPHLVVDPERGRDCYRLTLKYGKDWTEELYFRDQELSCLAEDWDQQKAIDHRLSHALDRIASSLAHAAH